MTRPTRFLGPAEAAVRLGVSAKALRIYEQHGLLAPARNAAGWRSYGPTEMQRGSDIVALRSLGLSLAQVAGVLNGRSDGLAPALLAHQTLLECQARQLAATIEKVRTLRGGAGKGQPPTVKDLASLQDLATEQHIEFSLPWPWGGEIFTLRGIRPVNYIVGPLGSGKTRLALRLAEVLPSAAFMGMERVDDGHAAVRLAADLNLRARVHHTLQWLQGHGATVSDALLALLAGLEAEGPAMLVIDLMEHGLDAAAQEAVAAFLRHRRVGDRPLFVLTRSSAILDLACVGADAAIILCPANHSLPTRVDPYPGAPGYEAVATCLATPEVRARTQGVIAWQSPRSSHLHQSVCAAKG